MRCTNSDKPARWQAKALDLSIAERQGADPACSLAEASVCPLCTSVWYHRQVDIVACKDFAVFFEAYALQPVLKIGHR